MQQVNKASLFKIVWFSIVPHGIKGISSKRQRSCGSGYMVRYDVHCSLELGKLHKNAQFLFSLSIYSFIKNPKEKMIPISFR